MDAHKKKQILKDILTALMDNNNQVLVETVNAHPNRDIPGVWSAAVGADITETPLPRFGNGLNNRLHAKSVKIGKDISMKITVNGQCVIHTPTGQARFGAVEATDAGVDMIWGAALNKYELGAHTDFMYRVKRYMHDEELRQIAKGPIVPACETSKFEQAKKQLEGLGISPDRLAQYYAQTHGRDK